MPDGVFGEYPMNEASLTYRPFFMTSQQNLLNLKAHFIIFNNPRASTAGVPLTTEQHFATMTLGNWITNRPQVINDVHARRIHQKRLVSTTGGDLQRSIWSADSHQRDLLMLLHCLLVKGHARQQLVVIQFQYCPSLPEVFKPTRLHLPIPTVSAITCPKIPICAVDIHKSPPLGDL